MERPSTAEIVFEVAGDRTAAPQDGQLFCNATRDWESLPPHEPQMLSIQKFPLDTVSNESTCVPSCTGMQQGENDQDLALWM